MTIDEKIVLMKARLTKLNGRDKNVKSPGVKRKLERRLRKMQNDRFLV